MRSLGENGVHQAPCAVKGPGKQERRQDRPSDFLRAVRHGHVRRVSRCGTWRERTDDRPQDEELRDGAADDGYPEETVEQCWRHGGEN